MPPGLSAELVATAMSEDPEAAGAEWLAEFRRDMAAPLEGDAIPRCIVPRMAEPPVGPRHLHRYLAFVDPSGGSGCDSYTLAIAHAEQDSDRIVLDCMREVKPPLDP